MSPPDPSVENKRSGKKGGMEVQFFGDNWVDTVMRRKYKDVTKDFSKRVQEEEGDAGIDEDVQQLFPLRR